jgi:hypothetical protein
MFLSNSATGGSRRVMAGAAARECGQVMRRSEVVRRILRGGVRDYNRRCRSGGVLLRASEGVHRLPCDSGWMSCSSLGGNGSPVCG